MALRECVFLFSVLITFAHARAVVVNCEMYPFHSQCRGVQTKRFVIEPGHKNQHENEFKNLNSPSFKEEYNGLKNSRLWTTLLDNGLSTDDLYDVYASSSASTRGNNKKNNRKNSIKDRLRIRRIPIRDFLSDLEFLDSDY
ncbi:uncharacterized protein LOC122508491 [Leptopilina heterotoma]|uniref:uncharacterized protein LOC122508491 n=1 Tax=Leptopilina heterotoma TaxID=63436 RepID=UPI001CA98136|nr:uncharacterized protein LOC122508491 [Leptopilina heterotoma]